MCCKTEVSIQRPTGVPCSLQVRKGGSSKGEGDARLNYPLSRSLGGGGCFALRAVPLQHWGGREEEGREGGSSPPLFPPPPPRRRRRIKNAQESFTQIQKEKLNGKSVERHTMIYGFFSERFFSGRKLCYIHAVYFNINYLGAAWIQRVKYCRSFQRARIGFRKKISFVAT